MYIQSMYFIYIMQVLFICLICQFLVLFKSFSLFFPRLPLPTFRQFSLFWQESTTLYLSPTHYEL